MRAIRVDGWQDHPIYGSLLSPETAVVPKMPPIDTSYKL